MFDTVAQRNLIARSGQDGPDQPTSTAKSETAFVNLYGYEHNYRARGGQSMGAGDCTDRRASATGQSTVRT